MYWLRAQAALAHTRIVVVSGDPQVQAAAVAAGADAALLTPFSAATLLAAVAFP